MESLLSALYGMMKDRYDFELKENEGYKEAIARVERHFAKVQDAMGEEFCSKLEDCVYEADQEEREAAFAWGLRLGLELHAL